ncbi:unnamed protein product, partial [Phaedon cochleariae]
MIMQWRTFSKMNFPLFITCLLPFITSATCLLPFITSAGILSPTTGRRGNIRERSTSNYGIKKEDLESAVTFAYHTTNMSERLEDNIKGRVGISNGSPSFGLNIAYRSEDRAIERGRKALIAARATVQLANMFCMSYKLNYDDCLAAINKFSLKDSSLKSVCDHLEKKCSPEEYQNMYRSAEGSCNNIKKSSLGESFTGYTRLLAPDYSDNINTVRRARNKDALPNARRVGSAIIDEIKFANDRLTLAVIQWGQFLEHDLSRFAFPVMYHYNISFDCCDRDGRNLAPRYLHPLCMAVGVPPDNEYTFASGLSCISYARSLPAVGNDCRFGWINQLNQATHFLDGSQVYGVTFEKTSELRSYTNGMLKMHQIGEKHYLPSSENPSENCQVETKNAACFTAGDPRVNQHPRLTVMHTISVREHNRIARKLREMNEHWDDEKLFQETRRIVVAEMQHITYNDWVPKILGEKKLQNAGETYQESVDPTVSNSFATAAIRSLHSMFSDHFRLLDEDRNNADSPSINYKGHFNNPGIILKVDVFDSLIRGLASESIGNVDARSQKLPNESFTDENFGYDTLTLDVQRSRDHGLPSYNAYRKHCGLKMASSMQNFADHMTSA